MIKSKTILIISAVAVLTFANSLFNNFVGDDWVLFVQNDFYKNPANIAKLATPEFITDFADLDPASSPEGRSFSGCVSYRPLTALSFFIDYGIWKMNPFGYHLTNLILHLTAALLVFSLLNLILQKENVALLGALLFAVHPVQVEVINNIGYRSDLLSMCCYLFALIGFIRQREGGKISFVYYVSFALALLAKETAVTLPIVLWVYDLCNREGRSFREFRVQYVVLFSILLGYLYIYLFVFPNANSPGFFIFDFVTQISIAAKVFAHYLGALFWPFNITVLPPMYQPGIDPLPVFEIIFSAVFLAGCAFLSLRFRKSSPALIFFISWFFITYALTSNIIPMPNPFAYRYLYLPSVGVFAVFALAIERMSAWFASQSRTTRPFLILKILLVGICITATLPSNEFFKNNVVLCREMLKHYPDASRPYWILGLTYLQAKQYDKAVEYFKKYLELGPGNPFMARMGQEYFVHHQLGRCYVSDPDKAIKEFKIAVSLKPGYALAYADLARAYIFKKDFQESQKYALKTIALEENALIGYIYAIHSAVELGQGEEAKRLFDIAWRLSPGDENLEFLRRYMEQKL